MVKDYEDVKVVRIRDVDGDKVQHILKTMAEGMRDVPEEYKDTVHADWDVNYDGEVSVEVFYKRPLTGEEFAAATEYNRVAREAAVKADLKWHTEALELLRKENPEALKRWENEL